MVYGRLSAGVIRLVPETVVYQQKSVSNPPSKFLLENNWKPVVFVMQPDELHSEMNWMEETNAIVQVWSTPASSSTQGSDPPASEDPNTPAAEDPNTPAAEEVT